MTTTSSRLFATSAALLAIVSSVTLLVGCDPQETRTVARDAGQAVGQAGEAVAAKTRDVAITAEVNARLAGDSQLSALSINVDTASGNVVLRGSAPDTASRTRASELASAVDGVVRVDNQLSVQPKN